jgi:SAM-dependent methyltransferase
MTSPSCAKVHRAAVEHIRALGLPAGARILDAPCGEGELATELQKLGYEMFGADITQEARGILGDHFRRADLNGGLPWPDASFDLIACIEGIEHLENPSAFLREAHRLVKPGGHLLVTTPNIASIRSRMRFFGSGFYNQDPRPLSEAARHPLHHIGLRTFPEWRYLLHTSGFHLEHVSAAHTKPISYFYAVYAPWMWAYARIAFRKEKNAAQRACNREIRKTLYSPALLLGENILLIARRA